MIAIARHAYSTTINPLKALPDSNSEKNRVLFAYDDRHGFIKRRDRAPSMDERVAASHCLS